MTTASTADNEKHEHVKADRAMKSSACKLLTLPRELRDRIYELCLKNEDTNEELDDMRENFGFPIHSTGVLFEGYSLATPPLLQVSRQIGAEAGPVWLNTNQFLIRVEGLDAVVLWRWSQICKSLTDAPKKQAYGSAFNPVLHIQSGWRGQYQWAKLAQWCRWVHAGDLEPPRLERRSREFCDQGQRFAEGALQIAQNHRGRSWDECEISLLGLRIALDGLYDDDGVTFT